MWKKVVPTTQGDLLRSKRKQSSRVIWRCERCRRRGVTVCVCVPKHVKGPVIAFAAKTSMCNCSNSSLFADYKGCTFTVGSALDDCMAGNNCNVTDSPFQAIG